MKKAFLIFILALPIVSCELYLQPEIDDIVQYVDDEPKWWV